MQSHLEITSTDPIGLKHVRRIENDAPHKILQFLLGRKPITIENLFPDLSIVRANGATVTGNHVDCWHSDKWTVHQGDASPERKGSHLDPWIEEGESLELRPDRHPTWEYIVSQWLHLRPVYTKIMVRQRS